MKSSAKKIELASVDDLFSTEEGRQDAKLEKIQEIPLSELHPFKNHPFKVKDDEAMMCRTVWWHFMIWTVRGGRETLPSARAVSSARATRIPLSMCTAM